METLAFQFHLMILSPDEVEPGISATRNGWAEQPRSGNSPASVRSKHALGTPYPRATTPCVRDLYIILFPAQKERGAVPMQPGNSGWEHMIFQVGLSMPLAGSGCLQRAPSRRRGENCPNNKWNDASSAPNRGDNLG